MEPQPNSQPPQGYQSPLQQPVMQPELPQPPHHDELPPGTLTKHTSGFPAMLVGLAVGSFLVGGMMYVTLQAAQSENAALKAELTSKEKQSVTPSLTPSVSAMGTEAEQPGMDTTQVPQGAATTEVGTTATNTNLVTYQDKNIPALKFQYDPRVWKLEKNTQTGFNTLKKIKDNNTIINIIDLAQFKDQTEGMYSNAEVSTKTNAITVGQFTRLSKVFTFYLADSNSPLYGRYRYYLTKNMFNMPDGANQYADIKSAFCDNEEYFAGMGSFVDCKIFKAGENIISFKLKDVLIEYNGQTPQEADDIVKQIKLD